MADLPYIYSIRLSNIPIHINLREFTIFLEQYYGKVTSLHLRELFTNTKACVFRFVDEELTYSFLRNVSIRYYSHIIDVECVNYIASFSTMYGSKSVFRSAQDVFIGSLSSYVDAYLLFNKMHTFGRVISAKVIVDDYGYSKCYGFVKFESPKIATRASTVHTIFIDNKKAYIRKRRFFNDVECSHNNTLEINENIFEDVECSHNNVDKRAVDENIFADEMCVDM
jgi:RNA recognition motif-containing protein